jgi:cytosine/adenosine deaminase-related metal-dependent hydrolase
LTETLVDLPAREAILVRGAYVITMDHALGDLPDGDILIRDGKIAAVGRGLDAADAVALDGHDMIALPGFVETHWHLWNCTLRGFVNYLEHSESYFPLTMRLGPLSTPHDAYCNVRLGVAEALLSGITTIHDWAHNIVSPAHADAEVRALRESGVRARFSYGWGQDLPVERTMDSGDVARIKRESFDGDTLLSLGVALRTPVAYQRGNVPVDVLMQDSAAARALGLPLTIHNRAGVVTLLEQHGLLGPDLLLVHPQALTTEEINLLVSRQVKVSSSPVNENARGIKGPRGPIQFSDLLEAGVQWSISVDEVATSGKVDFFAVLRELIRSDWQRAGGQTRITPRRILELATIEGAKALGLSDRVGSLTPGKRADVTLIRKTDVNMTPTIGDPSMMLVFAAQPNNVDTVVIDGRRLVSEGRLTSLNLEEICRAALESARSLQARDAARTQKAAIIG